MMDIDSGAITMPPRPGRENVAKLDDAESEEI